MPGPSRGWNRPADGPAPPERYDDASRGERLQKVLAAAGLGSRRACETIIESGAVTVNDIVVDRLPAWVDPLRDRVEVEGQPIGRQEQPVYVMLFKPRGVLCTHHDQEGRKLAVDLVNHPSKARLYSVGRLDMDSSGLLLLTNDGPLANRLTHPRYGVHRAYEVTVAGALEEEDVEKLERGIFLSDAHTSHGAKRGRRTAPSKLTLLRRGRDRTQLLMELHEGRNRQIRRMMLYVGHKVKKLRRVRLGPLTLSGLRPGEWRDLTPDEVKALRKAAGASGS